MGGDFDEGAGHRHFSGAAFNKTWEYLDLKERSVAETELMLHAAHASMWHWLARADADAEKRSVGYWLLGRAYASAGRAGEALRYSGLALEEAEAGALGPFYLGYALEAVARAYSLLLRPEEAAAFKARAQAELGRVEDPESKAALAADLASI